MASSDLRDELKCSICLSPYTDPVSLTCGHNFCRSCIVRALDAQEAAGAYSCPDCRAEYPQRPALEKNRKLRNIVQRFLSAQPEMEETTIFCTYCIKSPVPAVRSCLQCETSLCDDHLTAHNTTVDHILTEPTRSFGKKKCSTHKKVLEYYCPQDAACLCVSCCLVGKHRGHQVELLDDASENMKEKLREYLDEVNPQKAELKKRIQNLHDYKRTIHKKISEKSKSISKLFMAMKKELETAEKKVLSEISRQEDKIVEQISHLFKELEKKDKEMSRKIRHAEEMCRVTDPIRLLQETDITVISRRDINSEGDLYETEEEYWDNAHFHESGDYMTLETISLIRYQISGSVMSRMSESRYKGPDMLMDEISNDLDEDLISMTLHRCMRTIVNNATSEVGFQVPDIELDEDTADKNVEISDSLKTATDTKKEQDSPKTATASKVVQDRPNSPGRFRSCSQVLSRCGFSSGRHYWEVEWNQIGTCGIGMSYPSIEREGEQSSIGYNDISWGLYISDGIYEALQETFSSVLNVSPTCPTFGFLLDYEEGRLSFYELCDPIRHLHTFTASFTEPLHVIFYVGDGASVTLLS